MSITKEQAATWFETMHPPGPAAREMYRMAAEALRAQSVVEWSLSPRESLLGGDGDAGGDRMKIEIDIGEYFTQEMIKEIAEDELRKSFRRQFQKESDVERVISNLSYEFVFTLVAEQWDGDFTELLRKKIKGAIEDDTLKYIVFRRKDAWDRTESPAVAILDEECKNARPLIRECVEKHIREYPFHELDRDEIGDVIYDVIMERILSPRKEAKP